MNLEELMTEQRNKRTMDLDDMSVREILEVMKDVYKRQVRESTS